MLLNTACFGVISPSSCKKGDFGQMLNPQILKMLQMGTIQLFWTKMGPRTGEFHEFPPLRRCILFPKKKLYRFYMAFAKNQLLKMIFLSSMLFLWGVVDIGKFLTSSQNPSKSNIPNAKTIRRWKKTLGRSHGAPIPNIQKHCERTNTPRWIKFGLILFFGGREIKSYSLKDHWDV